MKKVLASLLAMFIFAAGVPLAVSAQTSCSRYARSKKSHSARNYSPRKYRNANYRANNYRPANYNDPYYEPQSFATTYKRPSFYRRHRNLVNMGIATGGGTLLGALIGGKKGALIGALTGAGAGAVYTYGLNKKKRKY